LRNAFRPFRVAFAALGCKTNRYDAATVRDRLPAGVFEEVPFESEADAYVVFTCTVTHLADRQSRQFIYQAHKRNPDAAVIAAGCYPTVGAEELRKIEGLTRVMEDVSTDALLAELYEMAGVDLQFEDENHFNLARFEDRSRPFLKIQDGCDNYCSYCIIPYTRGKPRSVPLKTILCRLEKLAESGYKEVVLTGISQGKWNQSEPEKLSFAGLIKAIDEAAFLPRIRISSIEPPDLTDELIEVVAASKCICPHLHVALQSGCNSVLARMNRRYTTEFYRERLEASRSVIKDLYWGADVIVGFPQESDEEFESTFNFIQSLDIQYLHVFPYSARKNTPAAEMEGQVHPQTARERAAKLRALSRRSREKAALAAIGKTVEVLIETPSDGRNPARGLSRDYHTVWVDSPGLSKNQIIGVTVEKLYNSWHLMGVPAKLEDMNDGS